MNKDGLPYNPRREVPTMKVVVTPAARKQAVRAIPLETEMSGEDDEGGAGSASWPKAEDVKDKPVRQTFYKPMSEASSSGEPMQRKGARSSSP